MSGFRYQDAQAAGWNQANAEMILARESFLLRTDPKVLAALRKWAEDDLRSANGQLEFVLRKALREAGRLKQDDTKKRDP